MLLQQNNGNIELGSFLFGMGLFTILNFKLWLYTAKIGMIFDNKLSFIIDLIICLIGNFIGDLILAGLLLLTKLEPTLKAQSTMIVNDKLNDDNSSIFILSFMCGVLIYLAVKGYQKCEYSTGKVVFCYLGLMIFILSKHEHCVTNFVYFIYARQFNLKVMICLVLMVVGDSTGSIAFDVLIKVVEWLNKINNEYDKKEIRLHEAIDSMKDI